MGRSPRCSTYSHAPRQRNGRRRRSRRAVRRARTARRGAVPRGAGSACPSPRQRRGVLRLPVEEIGPQGEVAVHRGGREVASRVLRRLTSSASTRVSCAHATPGRVAVGLPRQRRPVQRGEDLLAAVAGVALQRHVLQALAERLRQVPGAVERERGPSSRRSPRTRRDGARRWPRPGVVRGEPARVGQSWKNSMRAKRCSRSVSSVVARARRVGELRVHARPLGVVDVGERRDPLEQRVPRRGRQARWAGRPRGAAPSRSCDAVDLGEVAAGSRR